MTPLLLLLATFGVAFAPLVMADKDTDFYYPGFSNPNIKKKMYWKDSYNVLEDLDQFSALYITYHNCVHSLYEQDIGSGQDEDNEGYDYWYLYGRPVFRANSAFSLYGVLKGDSVRERSGSICHKGTYINSFFTTEGVETITYPFGISGSDGDGDYGPSSECAGDDQDGGGGGERRLASQTERDLSGSGSGSGDGGESAGTACYNGQFVYGTFDGRSCAGSTVSEVIDTFDDFNAAMENITCTQIYSEEGSIAYSRIFSNGKRRRRLEEAYDDGYYAGDDNAGDDNAAYDDGYENDGYYNDDAGDDGSYSGYDPLTILESSASCSLALYPDLCPDPYGLKQRYENKLNRALSHRPTVSAGKANNTLTIISSIFLAVGLILFGSAYYIFKTASDGRSIKSGNEEAQDEAPKEKSSSMIRQLTSSISNKSLQLRDSFRSYAEEEEDDIVGVPENYTTESRFGSFFGGSAASAQSSDQLQEEEAYVQVVDSPAEEPKSSVEGDASPSHQDAEVADPSGTVGASPQPAVDSTPTAAVKKKRKRPMLNKISKTLFGRNK